MSWTLSPRPREPVDQKMKGVLFEFSAPLASWATSGAAVRATDAVPTWSAMTGLLAAALGWGREDERIAALARDYAMAVRVIEPGSRLEDYHTVQSPDAARAGRARVQTRADELDAGEPNTTITRREYLSGARYSMLVLTAAERPVATPEALVRALREPVYALYAGRRSCPLARIGAKVVAGDLDSLLPDATHWDSRLPTSRTPSLVRERRDMRVGARRFAVRKECVA
jgi:CRISPR-associated protein Cas5/CasD subtype I-E